MTNAPIQAGFSVYGDFPTYRSGKLIIHNKQQIQEQIGLDWRKFVLGGLCTSAQSDQRLCYSLF